MRVRARRGRGEGARARGHARPMPEYQCGTVSNRRTLRPTRQNNQITTRPATACVRPASTRSEDYAHLKQEQPSASNGPSHCPILDASHRPSSCSRACWTRKHPDWTSRLKKRQATGSGDKVSSRVTHPEGTAWQSERPRAPPEHPRAECPLTTTLLPHPPHPTRVPETIRPARMRLRLSLLPPTL